MSSQIKMLTHTDTLEVSEVKRPANRKKFAITKSEITMSAVNAVIATPVEGEEQFVATLKSEGADAARIEAATAMFRLRKGYADVLTPEDMGLSTKAHKEPDGDEQGEDETDAEYKSRKAKKSQKSAAAPVAKSADMSPEARSQVEAVFKSNELLTSKVRELETRNELMELTTKAEQELSHAPGSPQELAVTLKAARDVGEDTYNRVFSALKSSSDCIAKSELFRDIGTNGGGVAAAAHDKIMALANGLTIKADSGKEMTLAQKYSYVISQTAEGRDLYKQYNKEQDLAIKRA